MSTRKRGLGRGLDALLGGSVPAAVVEAEAEEVAVAEPPAVQGEADSGALKEVAVDLIARSPYQPRTEFEPERLQELANSIAAQGVMQPVVVRPLQAGRYELIAGERRWRAAQLAGLQDIPVVVRDVSDQAAMAMALIENIQREDLNPLEEANAMQRLQKEFELTQQEVADAVGRSRSAVTNMLRLLELENDVQTCLAQGEIDMGHARALLGLDGAVQSGAAETVVARGLSVRETEALVRRLKEGPVRRPGAAPVDPDVRRLEDNLTDKLGCPVHIQAGKGGRGKLVISYTSLEELDGLLEHIH